MPEAGIRQRRTEQRSITLSLLYWQLRYPRLVPLDRWLCVTTFRLVCPYSVVNRLALADYPCCYELVPEIIVALPNQNKTCRKIATDYVIRKCRKPIFAARRSQNVGRWDGLLQGARHRNGSAVGTASYRERDTATGRPLGRPPTGSVTPRKGRPPSGPVGARPSARPCRPLALSPLRGDGLLQGRRRRNDPAVNGNHDTRHIASRLRCQVNRDTRHIAGLTNAFQRHTVSYFFADGVKRMRHHLARKRARCNRVYGDASRGQV